MKKLFENWRKYVNEERDRRFTGEPGWIERLKRDRAREEEEEDDWGPGPEPDISPEELEDATETDTPEELEDEEDIA